MSECNDTTPIMILEPHSVM